MMRFWGFLVILAFASFPVLAGESSPARVFDFKGVVVGGPATPEEIQEKLGVHCGGGGWGGTDGYVCNGDTTVARVSAYMNLVINAQGIVQRIHLLFDSGAFGIVERELILKFGEPDDTAHSTLQNPYGATFEQITHLWSGAGGVWVRFSRYAGKIDNSSLYFTTAEDLAILDKRAGDRSKDM